MSILPIDTVTPYNEACENGWFDMNVSRSYHHPERATYYIVFVARDGYRVVQSFSDKCSAQTFLDKLNSLHDVAACNALLGRK